VRDDSRHFIFRDQRERAEYGSPIRPLIDRKTAGNLECSIVASTLDYCNSVLYGVSGSNIAKPAANAK